MDLKETKAKIVSTSSMKTCQPLTPFLSHHGINVSADDDMSLMRRICLTNWQRFSPLYTLQTALMSWKKHMTTTSGMPLTLNPFHVYASTPAQTINPAGSHCECKGEIIRAGHASFHFLCLQLIDCIFYLTFWIPWRLPIKTNNGLVVGLFEGKYYGNINLYFENKHTYQPLSSASRGCPRKRPSTLLCNSNSDIFCGNKKWGQTLNLFNVFTILYKLVCYVRAAADKLQCWM